MDNSISTEHLPAFISKMEAEGLPPLVIDTFSFYYKQVLTGKTGMIYDHDILPVASEEIEDAAQLDRFTDAGRNAFPHAVRIVLNGGLGTSMGLMGPKSLLEAKRGLSFLNIILKQSQSRHVQMALMNSFSTQEDTLAALSELKPPRMPLTFLQHKFPKVLQKDFSPASWSKNPALEWNPPGHGDVYTALYTSGMLQQLMGDGVQYAFISNSDNLGARMNASLLGYFAENKFPFMMEVAEKTPADLKGGHIARHKNGRLILRESAQCPRDELDAFEDIKRYQYFNTNSVWINLKSLSELFEKEKMIRLPMILNPKTLDPRDESSPAVYQIETAMGAAISLFQGATAVRVPRSRFFPVKTCNDLLALRSDVFVYTAEKNLHVNPDRKAKGKADKIKIKLDPKYYKKIDDLDNRFSQGSPSLVDCESLIVEGDVRFENNVVIKGTVTIKNSGTSQAVIKAGTVIDKDINM
jgi:UTP--glucose-1-phosphate uridylyltransferase